MTWKNHLGDIPVSLFFIGMVVGKAEEHLENLPLSIKAVGILLPLFGVVYALGVLHGSINQFKHQILLEHASLKAEVQEINDWKNQGNRFTTEMGDRLEKKIDKAIEQSERALNNDTVNRTNIENIMHRLKDHRH